MTEREQQANNMLQSIARDIASKLPENFGFCLLAYEFGDAKDKKMLYVSNGNRDDVAKAMKEWIETVDKQSFGKDI